MHFDVDHVIRIPFDSYFDFVLSERFNDWVKKTLQQDERKIVRSEEIDGVLYRTVRSERILSTKAQKYFKVPRLIIEDRQEIRRAEGLFAWEYVPNVGASRFSAKGTGRIEPFGEHVKRTISGDVTFKIPLIGKRIERRVVEWVRENISKIGDALERYYHKHHVSDK